jgi:hypothetical protein
MKTARVALVAAALAALVLPTPAAAASPLIQLYDCRRLGADGTLPAEVPHPESYLVRRHGHGRLAVLDVDELTAGLDVRLVYACRLGVPGVGR